MWETTRKQIYCGYKQLNKLNKCHERRRADYNHYSPALPASPFVQA